MWDNQFEDMLRDALPFLPADQAITEDLDLQDFGLDSFGIIDLLLTIETGYGIRFRDEAMNRETFATPDSLWSTISSLRAAA